jgi:hypothetical protein
VEQSPLPRRALAPEGADEAPFEVNFVPGRRWASPPDEPVEPVEDTLTPIPPPAPVLPVSERRAAAGRRFSADEPAGEREEHAPRRSASSPTPYGLSPSYDSREPAPVPIAAAPVHPVHVRWFWPVVGIAVSAALILAFTLIPRLARPTVPGGTATVKALLLSEPADLDVLRPGTTWAATSDVAPDETKGIRCVLPSGQLKTPPLEGSVVRRTLSATSGDAASVVEQVETYADANAAAGAFAVRSTQLGGCTGTPDLVAKGFTVGGLGDQSLAVQVTEQDATAVAHTLVLVRTGSTILIADAHAGATPLASDALARALVPALKRLCVPVSGTCPTTPTVADAEVPPPGEFAGALATGDLPRVTPGTGTWVAAEIKPMKLAGSGCEGVDLTAPPKSTTAVQHAYLLTGDAAASPNFGLDEVVYTFASEADAKAFVDSVSANITDCAKTQATATVAAAGTLPQPASGSLFTVDQRKTLDKAARSQVFVSYSGTRAVYLAANPTPTFDLTATNWLAVGQRAISRAKQLP